MEEGKQELTLAQIRKEKKELDRKINELILPLLSEFTRKTEVKIARLHLIPIDCYPVFFESSRLHVPVNHYVVNTELELFL